MSLIDKLKRINTKGESYIDSSFVRTSEIYALIKLIIDRYTETGYSHMELFMKLPNDKSVPRGKQRVKQITGVNKGRIYLADKEKSGSFHFDDYKPIDFNFATLMGDKMLDLRTDGEALDRFIQLRNDTVKNRMVCSFEKLFLYATGEKLESASHDTEDSSTRK